MLWDTHMHTRYSTDSEAEPSEMAKEAIRRGLEGICITDHLDFDYPQAAAAHRMDRGEARNRNFCWM